MVFSMETRRFSHEMASLRNIGGLGNLFPVGCSGSGRSRAGGLCLFWREGLEVEFISSSLNHILRMVTDPDTSSSVQVLAIYGWPEEHNKWRTWDLVRRYKPDDSVPWLCIGDFNEVLSPNDKLGGGPVDVARLQDCARTIADCGLRDVGYSGYRFTWSNKRKAPGTVEERLDYALVNDKWLEQWPVSHVSHLPRYRSDHNPIRMWFGVRRKQEETRRERMFRFEEVWLQKMRSAWRLSRRLGALGEGARRVQSEQVVEETTTVEGQLDALLEQEEIVWCQRSRATWLRHGDRNTGFFHRKASQRRKRNSIEEIETEDGRTVDEVKDIYRVLADYFMSLFSSAGPIDIDSVTSLVAGRLTAHHLEILTRPFTKEDVEEALFQMHPNKAPGADGLPTLFYHKFWHIIGEDISQFCLHVLHGSISPGIINRTLLVLIPKVKKPLHANQFRPISLCNVIFKIITKTMANRLKLILPDIICEAQSAFVPGRLITDNALVAFECFHFMKKKTSGRNGVLALKLDMSKAYDRVEWPFLASVLTQMGFPLSWVNLIMSCVTTMNFSILLNGAPQTPFAPGRGLRQGDPLSPYLFILCGEVFSALINKAVMSSSLHGVKVARSAPVISHLLFADDSVIFAKATPEEVESVKEILSTYERVSGQVINLDKSTLTCSRNVPDNCFNHLKGLMNVKVVEHFDKYLGLPTIIGKSKTQIFNFVKERVWKKLKGWKERVLSRAGREVLLGCNVDNRCVHWLKWDSLCQPKCKGGLGFRDFKAFNIALVGKNWWRIMSKPNTMLARVYKSVYFPRQTMFGAKKGYRPSYAWSSLLGSAWVFEQGGLWRVGDGKTIRAWDDKWIPSSTPMVYREDVAAELHVTHVSDLMLPNGGGWDRDKVEFLCWPPTATAILSVPLPMYHQEDSFFWPATVDGCYSSKTGYQFIRNQHHARVASGSSAPAMRPALWLKLWKAEVWFASPLGFRLHEECSVQEFFTEFLGAADCNGIGMFFSILYSVWQARNDLLFSAKQSSVDQILLRASSLRPSSNQLTAPHRHGREHVSSWRRPAAGIFKVNFDASLLQSHEAGFGFIARNKEGEVLAAATSTMGPVLSSVLAEALALRWALGLAKELGFRRIWVETDCLVLYNYWERREGGFSHLETVVKDCRLLLCSFDVFTFTFVRRTGNSVADALAKLAFRLGCLVWIEEAPLEVSSLIQDDVFASVASSL
ncbi:uncharacterized protein LOC130732189 [Lotus japonicus]|uniref:uncharacterized protein LOC130732189 n=1 Tax=Lotus japonicus TaxID=34305 RepID=UPI002583E83D|nr:uncharacterized protein LOC130732189 [Lotus japonicus]